MNSRLRRWLGAALLWATLAPGCERARPHTAQRPTVADAAEARPSVAAKARLKAAVAGVRRVLASVGVVVPLVVLEHDLRGALLPLRRDQLLADGDMAAAVLAPLRERVLPLARDCAPGGVCVVLVAEIAPASSAAAAVLPELQGLALGPLAFAGGDDGLRAVARAAGYEAGGGPTVVLVSARHLMRRTGHGATALLLHEIGHALGLKHVPEPGRVMSVAGGSALATGFTDDELQRLRKAAEAQLGPVNSRASHRGGDGRRR